MRDRVSDAVPANLPAQKMQNPADALTLTQQVAGRVPEALGKRGAAMRAPMTLRKMLRVLSVNLG